MCTVCILVQLFVQILILTIIVYNNVYCTDTGSVICTDPDSYHHSLSFHQHVCAVLVLTQSRVGALFIAIKWSKLKSDKKQRSILWFLSETDAGQRHLVAVGGDPGVDHHRPLPFPVLLHLWLWHCARNWPGGLHHAAHLLQRRRRVGILLQRLLDWRRNECKCHRKFCKYHAVLFWVRLVLSPEFCLTLLPIFWLCCFFQKYNFFVFCSLFVSGLSVLCWC